jgi:uroporphyrinogen III methyltransferase/synthase
MERVGAMSARAGVVYLVGAGPGDPGLMTARALELIASADTILYDRLIPPGALDGARRDAELIYVGKSPEPESSDAQSEHGGAGSGAGETARRSVSVSQGETNERLAAAARAGRSVVRLKGGDPFVFGRGGEEGEALRAAEIEFEVVPGVTAGVAAAAYAGIPVTHRDDASAVAFVTGHEDPEKDETALEWDALARFPGTLVFYMGVKRLAANAVALIEAGRDPDEPAAAVERGTMEGQRTVVATLATLAEAVEREGVGAPALIVVGPVVARREELAWLERRPLHGRRVVVTRARAQASGLAATLRALGAMVVELPAIRIEPRIESEEVRRAVERIGEYALVCLTSPNGVRLLFEALGEAGLDARAFGEGPKQQQVGEGGESGVRAKDDAQGGLDSVSVEPPQQRELEGGREPGAASEGPARRGSAIGGLPRTDRTTIAAIGPGTAKALAENGLKADVLPERFVAEALVEALADVDVEGKRVLVARAVEARDVLPDALRGRGAEVDVVALYETVREEPAPEAVEAAQDADYVTFTSSSTVRNLTEALGDRFPTEARVVSIGPITSEAAREAGLTVAVEAERHDVDGLVEALLADATR